MPNNENEDRNHDQGSDNNGQSTSNVHGGEFGKGRKSQYKNNNPEHEDDVPNEFLSHKEY
ncbi:hypothetical protein ACFOQM_22420 [Paenibacillus sp. GCM10012307]|uniref:Uncharacterized protein n=1 Tax=Paenibacillus roseus TaxID=2798579 RepID=A0A934MR84_9BACL|nr:hypothetical protein [Paenibacillus roseus]MBJ6363986.1 hypothetical protein [Paenibacillus roseus]